MRYIDPEALQSMVEAKWISRRKHPHADLFIYNYTQQVQYERLWNDTTVKCRGLILDGNGEVVARPFEKFFNLSEHSPDQIPDEPFEIFEKFDGSYGILYWLGDRPQIATRGSFVSDQARHATEVLHHKYGHLLHKLDPEWTHVFEIIYPENRIVVDYGDMDDLILLTAIHNQTGTEHIPNIGFPTPKKYKASNIFELKNLTQDNKEGFVVRFNSGFRVKVKFEEYLRLHKLVFGVSSKTIWEYLSQNQALDELLERVPDEFYTWVQDTEKDLKQQFDAIVSECKSVYKELEDRKQTALYFQQQKYPAVLFSMLDGRDYDGIVWKLIKPEYSKPFKSE